MADEVNPETGEVIETAQLRRPPMPPVIAKAIIAVNKEVTSLASDAENKFAKFKYTSVDAFYEAIGPLMARAGIFVFTDEANTQIERRESTDDQGKTRVSNWLVTKYELMIYHESGAEWGPIRREMMVAATGPQAYGAGQSYVEKYFLRGLFKVPTGDGDADAQPQAGLPEKPQTRGTTRIARPMLPPATPPTANQTPASADIRQGKVTSATPSHGPSATGSGKTIARRMFAKSFLDGENYEIDPTKPGGWATWEKIYLGVADYTDSEGQLAKMQHDNREHIPKYQKAHGAEHYQWFCGRIADNAKRLQVQEAVTPAETQDVLMD